MTATTFDTLGYAKRLEEAGFTRQQAEVQANMLREIIATQDDENRREMATKMDITQSEMRIRVDLAEKIESSKNETLKWMMGMLIAQTAMILSIISYLK